MEPEKSRQQKQSEYRQLHKKTILSQTKLWRLRNPDRYKAIQDKYRKSPKGQAVILKSRNSKTQNQTGDLNHGS